MLYQENDFEHRHEVLEMLGDIQDENLRLRGALNESLRALLTLRKTLPHEPALLQCIADIRQALSD